MRYDKATLENRGGRVLSLRLSTCDGSCSVCELSDGAFALLDFDCSPSLLPFALDTRVSALKRESWQGERLGLASIDLGSVLLVRDWRIVGRVGVSFAAGSVDKFISIVARHSYATPDRRYYNINFEHDNDAV